MKERIKRLLPKNRFARSVSVLAGGTAAGQIIVVAASPILTRLYSPEDFGLFAVFASLLGILGVIASLRYQLAIPLPEDDADAARVAILSVLVVVGMAGLSALVVLFFGEPVSHLLNVPQLAPYLWLLPLGLFLLGVYQVLSYWAIRRRAYGPIARTKLTQSIVMTAVQIGGFALGPVALLIGRIMGQAAGIATLYRLVVRPKRHLLGEVRGRDVMWAAKRYRRFPIYSTWAGGFNTLGTETPPLLFAALFSPAVAGLYMLAHRVLAMPAQLIGKAVADVFFGDAPDNHRNDQLGTAVSRITATLSQIALPPIVLFSLFAPSLFSGIFGESWREAGVYAQWLAPMIYINFITSPITTLTTVLEKQAHALFFQSLLLVMRLSGLVVGALLGDIILAVILFSLGTFIARGIFLSWAHWVTNQPLVELLTNQASAMGWAFIVISPILVISWADDVLSLTMFAIVGSIAILVYRLWILQRTVGAQHER
ncbi:lipopolysaccharide biosynthesis protein [Thioalkalivibrio sp. ALJ15]|uniref:lipopolysaccharide biosynthesis protein n=1 Tax=Thioalkalivibrio sp. ALJ15 TaxID=748652 RepID=UPI00036D8801|nr:oligosaccharide flippase family protein [Thioalkalivibrio sp. ALJ15]